MAQMNVRTNQTTAVVRLRGERIETSVARYGRWRRRRCRWRWQRCRRRPFRRRRAVFGTPTAVRAGIYRLSRRLSDQSGAVTSRSLGGLYRVNHIFTGPPPPRTPSHLPSARRSHRRRHRPTGQRARPFANRGPDPVRRRAVAKSRSNGTRRIKKKKSTTEFSITDE